MFRIYDSTCFPKYIQGKYFIDWKAQGGSDPLFEIFFSRQRDGNYQFVAHSEHPGKEVSLVEQNVNFLEDVWFKVVAKSGLSILAESEPFSSGLLPSKVDKLRYREIIRRSELDIERFLGKRAGFLLRKKTYGDRASNVNPVLDVPIGLEDRESFGGKFEGGHLPPVKMFCGYIQNERGDKSTTTQEVGLSDVRRLGMVALHFPVISPYDIWVNQDTNDRYQVMAPVKTATFAGLPIKQIVTLSLLPRDDKAYRIEI
jgi:hypothetical protein